MSALNTDLYELTMAAGYFTAGKTKEVATFELSARKLPDNRNFLVAAGLQQAVEYLSDLRFTADEIDYLRSLVAFKNAPPEFFTFFVICVSAATFSRSRKALRSLRMSRLRSCVRLS
jgi:nicotinate phosphoribosyltransferase